MQRWQSRSLFPKLRPKPEKPMRIICAILALAALAVAACSSKPTRTGPSYDTSSRFVDMGDADADADARENPEGHIVDPNRPITVDFTDKNPRGGFNPVPGLEPMPFGESMFGGWGIGGAMIPATPGARVGAGGMDFAKGKRGVSFVKKPLHTVLRYIAAGSDRLQTITEEDAGEMLITCILPQGPYTTDEAATLIESICKANALDFVRDGNVVIVISGRKSKHPTAMCSAGSMTPITSTSRRPTCWMRSWKQRAYAACSC